MIEADAGRGVEDAEGADGASEFDDPLAGVAFGPLFLEKLLAGIIKAHPATDKTPPQRLRAAMLALLGHKGSGNPSAEDADDLALLWMKAQQLDRRRHNLKATNRGLAIEAAAKFVPGFDREPDMSPADRLREKFSGAYDRKQAKGRTNDVQRTLAYRVTRHDYILESVEAQMLERIAHELKLARVPIILPD